MSTRRSHGTEHPWGQLSVPSGIVRSSALRFLNEKWRENWIELLRLVLREIYSYRLREEYPGVDLSCMSHRIIKFCSDFPNLVEEDPSPHPPQALWPRIHGAGTAEGNRGCSCCLTLDTDFFGYLPKVLCILVTVMATGLTR